jgi:magnesium transporter
VAGSESESRSGRQKEQGVTTRISQFSGPAYTDGPMTGVTQPLPGVAWYDLNDPSSPALDELAKQYHLHELQIEDCRHIQRAKTEDYEGYIFTVLKALQPGKTPKFLDFDIFLGKDFLITVHAGSCPAIDKAVQRAQQQKMQRLDKLFYVLVDHTVDEYLLVLDALAEQISDVESDVLERPEPPVLRRIFSMKRNLIDFRRNAGGMREVVNQLMRREQGFLGDDLDPFFRDVYDHIVRTVDLIETYRDLLSSSTDIYLSAVANRTNQIVKVLTVWGTVALPLVVITGFFGMNLPLPWQHDPLGAVYASLLMAAIGGLILWYFRKQGWF